MFKLQVVLVPPSVQNAPLGYGLASSTAESSQLMGVNPLTAPRNGETTLPYAPSGNNTLAPYHFANRLRKFLHFTKSANSLLELSTEIDQKCAKMYPYVDELEILSLQDSQGCDLDPDFLVKDVFTMDNVVRVIIKNELEIDDSSPVSSYRAAKRKKLNTGVAQSPPPVQQSHAPASAASSSVLNIAKKRPAAFAMRHSTNNNMRVSTPLAHQIYPPREIHDRMVSNNSEEEDDDPGERSFLPPPAQPQSPPIRISSGMEMGKRIKSMVEDDTVSRSETVDPDKLRQQRLLSGTPVRSAMTPNRVTLTGQRVVSERQPSQPNNISVFTASNGNRKNSFATSRITSGRLSIPEPKIAEIEKELKEGPSSPSSLLPPKPDRIPMKKPLQGTEAQPSDEEYSSEEQETDRQVRAFIQRQTSSIADNNGSPTKNSPLSDDENVHLAELPQTRPTSVGAQKRKTSLEAKVEHKLSGGYSEEERLRIDNFSEDEDKGAREKEADRQWEGELDKTRNSQKPTGDEHDIDGNDTANETVVVRGKYRRPSATNSIHKEELVRFMEGDFSPAWNSRTSKDKPYTTVLHKDIDNSKPDPRNILPEKRTRYAAKKAAQLLAGKVENSPEVGFEQGAEASSSDNEPSSGIESDISSENNDSKVAVTENNSVKTLNIHPLKEAVIKGNDAALQSNPTSQLSKSDSDYSEGTSFGSSTDQEQNDPPQKESQLANESSKRISPADKKQTVAKPTDSTKRELTSIGLREKPIIQISPATVLPKVAVSGESKMQHPSSTEKEQPKALPKTTPISGPSNLGSPNNSIQPKSTSLTSALPVSLPAEGSNSKSVSKLASKGVKLNEEKKGKGTKDVQKQAEKEARQKAKEDAKRAKEEEATRKRKEREEKKRLKQEEIERKKKRLQEEVERKKKEEFKKQQEQLERRKEEFAEKKRQEELERQRREEEGRKKEAEMLKKRAEELERKKQEEIAQQKREEEERKKRTEEELERKRKEDEMRKKQEELEKKKVEDQERERQAEIEKKKQEEELERKKKAALEKKKQEEELERRRQADLEKKRQEEESERKRQAELEKKKQEEELERKRQAELEKRKQEEELERKRQAELERKRQEEDSEKKRQAELEKKRQNEELQRQKQVEFERKRQEDKLEKERQAELEKKKQLELEKKQQEELQRKKQADREKVRQEQAKQKTKALPSKSVKSPAAINGSDKLKELKARFTSSKTYVPATSKGSQKNNNKGSVNNDVESSEEGSSTEYSSSSSEEEDESSKKSRRKVVDTPRGSVTTGNQKSSPKKPASDGVESAPQSTQRGNLASQLSQNQVPVTRMMEKSSPSSSQAEPSTNSSILGGLPKKVRPSLSSLSDLVSRGVPEVKEKSSFSQNAAKVPSKKDNSDSEEDDSGDNSETESESSDSGSDDSDSDNSSFISAKKASTALGKKKKGSGGFASLLRDSQKR